MSLGDSEIPQVYVSLLNLATDSVFRAKLARIYAEDFFMNRFPPRNNRKMAFVATLVYVCSQADSSERLLNRIQSHSPVFKGISVIECEFDTLQTWFGTGPTILQTGSDETTRFAVWVSVFPGGLSTGALS